MSYDKKAHRPRPAVTRNMEGDRGLVVPPAVYSRDQLTATSLPAQVDPIDAGSPRDNPNTGSPRTRSRRQHQRKSHEMPSADPVSKQREKSPHPCNWVDYFGARAETEGYNSCLFLLWGSERSERAPTWAIDVPLTDNAEEKVFQCLKDHYQKYRGFWRTFGYLRQGATLSLVQFRFITRLGDRFQVWLTPINAKEMERNLVARSEELSAIVCKTFGDDEPCGVHEGRVIQHGYKCPLMDYHLEDAVCPVEKYLLVRGRLEWWRTIGFLSWFFRKPQAATGQKILDGPKGGEMILSDYKRIQRWLCYHQEPRFEEFYGLFVTDTWIVSRCVCAFIGITMLVVPVGKVLFGSWEAAFAVGSFILAIPVVVLAVLGYFQQF